MNNNRTVVQEQLKDEQYLASNWRTLSAAVAGILTADIASTSFSIAEELSRAEPLIIDHSAFIGSLIGAFVLTAGSIYSGLKSTAHAHRAASLEGALAYDLLSAPEPVLPEAPIAQ